MAGLGAGAGSVVQSAGPLSPEAAKMLGSTTPQPTYGLGSGGPGIGGSNVAIEMPGGGYTTPQGLAGPSTAGNAGNIAVNYPDMPGVPTSTAGPVGAAAAYSAPSSYASQEEVARTARMMAPSLAPASSGPSGGFGVPAGVLMAKTGLGAIQNLQTQKVYAQEVKRRKKTMDEIAAMEANPDLMYQNDSGLAAMRDRAKREALNSYAAKYGGTEGSEAQVARAMADFDRLALNDTINRKYNMLGATAPAQQAFANAGGGPLGALAGPAQGAISDALFMSWLSGMRR